MLHIFVALVEDKPGILTHTASRHRVTLRSFALAISALAIILGCNNTLNPLCGSARPAPLIGSLSPSTLTFAQVQDGRILVVNGSQFVSASEVLINSTPLATTVAPG